ncbi:MAG: PEP-CTERM sorting domain-containing protein [Rubripirellula sp.]|nr:PEP-CTERM sorting domain-containing protein [Rubripirellula sp.]
MTYTALTSDGNLRFQSSGFLFQNIPGAYYGTTMNVTGEGVFAIEFSTFVNRAGLLLSAVSSVGARLTWDVSSFSTSGILETASFSQPANGQAVFAGFERSENISGLLITKTSSEPFTFWDDVRYESAAVPEPTSLAIFGIGALGMIGTRRRRKREQQQSQTSLSQNELRAVIEVS